MTILGVSALAVAIVVVLGIVVAVALFRAMWRVAEPNEALVISGLHHKPIDHTGESLGFKIITGRGTLVIPGVQVVRRLSLDLRESELEIACVTKQGIPVHIKGVVIYKIGDDFASIANAARRFLDQQDRMDARIQNVFAGHLRAIVGSLTIEELIRERDRLTEATRGASGTEMEKLGLIVDSLQIQEIDDPTGYIENLARPFAAVVQRDARIAQAQADQEASTREAEAAALKASSQRDSKIKVAGYQAEVDRAAAEAKQAGPIADATARQKVVIEETKIAELDAQKTEQQLLATVRRPADAKAYEKETIATAQRNADIAAAEARARQIELQAQADATKTRVIGEAEASATRAKRSGRGRGDQRQGARRGAGDQGARRRAGREPGSGHRPAAGRAVAADRRGRGQGVRLGRPDGRAQRRARRLGDARQGDGAGHHRARSGPQPARPPRPPGRARRAGRAQRRSRDRARRPAVSLWRRIVRLITGEARSSLARLEDPAASVDAAYRLQLELVDEVRRHLVDLLTARKRLEMQVAAFARDGSRAAEVDAFRAEIAELKTSEDAVAAAAERLRRRADGLRAEREITAARVAAARAGIAAHGTIAGVNPEHAEIRTLLDDARDRTLALQARAAALAELVARDDAAARGTRSPQLPE